MKCAIVISTHKEILYGDELKSFMRCVEIFGNDYDIFINTKRSNRIDFFLKAYPKIKIMRQEDKFFSSYWSCSIMHRSRELYQSFLNYEYILTRQLDTWELNGNLNHFIDLGYDYYGAPIVKCPSWGTMCEIVGCGGYALRKTKTLFDILQPFDESAKSARENEFNDDLYICTQLSDRLKICPVEIASEFCFSAETKEILEYWYKRTNKLPMAVHIYKKNDTWDFWKNFITDYE